jgi:hypothetical protein
MFANMITSDGLVRVADGQLVENHVCNSLRITYVDTFLDTVRLHNNPPDDSLDYSRMNGTQVSNHHVSGGMSRRNISFPVNCAINILVNYGFHIDLHTFQESLHMLQ